MGRCCLRLRLLRLLRIGGCCKVFAISRVDPGVMVADEPAVKQRKRVPRLSKPRSAVVTAAQREKLLDLLSAGHGVNESLAQLDRSFSWYVHQRRTVPGFLEAVEQAKMLQKAPMFRSPSDARQVGFAEFSSRYLGMRVWPHMMNVVDLLEGREPSWLHPSMIFERGSSGNKRLLVNVPPNHGKSMTVTINYLTYRVCMDPNIAIIVISKTSQQAQKFLYGIKQRLTHPRYVELQRAYAPMEGFRASADQWTATKIYLGSSRDSDEKDPTVEALGLGGQVYGARAHLIVVDDAVTLVNANEHEKQMDWLRQEVSTRLGPGGELLVIGTRVAPVDLYRELRNPDHYTDGVVPWTYLGMPAVLEQDSPDPEGWVTLWPRSDAPFEGLADDPDGDGLYPRWSGPRLSRVRNEVGPQRWAMVYQQMDVAAEAVFHPVAVRGSVNGMRKPGPLKPGAVGHPDSVDGFVVVCAMDPAMSEDTATVAVALDRASGMRFVLDVDVMRAPSPARIRGLIREWTDRFRPVEWVIEQNAFQLFLTQDEEITRFLQSRGVPLKGHYTGRNKQDEAFGVASLSGLFGSVTSGERSRGLKHAGDNMIELPDLFSCPGAKVLVEQLVTWQPNVRGSKLKQDTVMALWMAELRLRELLGSAQGSVQWFGNGQFTSPSRREQRVVVALDEWASSRPMTFL